MQLRMLQSRTQSRPATELIEEEEDQWLILLDRHNDIESKNIKLKDRNSLDFRATKVGSRLLATKCKVAVVVSNTSS